MRLLGMALEAGLVEVRVGLGVPTFRDGGGKRVAWVTMEHIREAVVGAGLVSGREVDNLVAELGRLAEDDHDALSNRSPAIASSRLPTWVALFSFASRS